MEPTYLPHQPESPKRQYKTVYPAPEISDPNEVVDGVEIRLNIPDDQWEPVCFIGATAESRAESIAYLTAQIQSREALQSLAVYRFHGPFSEPQRADILLEIHNAINNALSRIQSEFPQEAPDSSMGNFEVRMSFGRQ